MAWTRAEERLWMFSLVSAPGVGDRAVRLEDGPRRRRKHRRNVFYTVVVVPVS